MIRESDLKIVEGWTKEHAEYCSEIWSVDFNFEIYESEVQTFYIRDLQIPGREELQFRHLFELEGKIQKSLDKDIE